MKIAVIGSGYVGLVTGTCFAETGNTVICMDIDQSKVSKLNGGELTIYEPDLDIYFERNLKNKRLSFTNNLEEAIREAEIVFLALPTPPGEGGSADVSRVLLVAGQIAEKMNHYLVVVNKSTVPVGTGAAVKAIMASKAKVEFDVVSNPEFLREGVAVQDFMKPERIVIGFESERARKKMHQLYEPFVRQGNPIIDMDIKSAELTKYAANAFLATKISFMNEIANLCDLLDADVDMVRKGIGTDSRIGKSFLFPGVGYGGSCFPKDVTALYQTAKENRYDFKILDAVLQVNAKQRHLFLDKVKRKFNGDLKGKVIALWGLAFKPNTDDIREAPAIYIIRELLDAGAVVKAYDPEAIGHTRNIFGNAVDFRDNQYEVLEGADCLLVVTEWNAFRSPDFALMKSKMKQAVIFDGRNVFNLDQMADNGFWYESIGRKPVNT